MDALAELELLLRPAGGGLYLVSTGREEQLRVQRRLYGVVTDDQVVEAFRARLRRLADARVVILGIPSDVGAGFLRGSNVAPLTLRTRLLDEDPQCFQRWEGAGVVDVGDVMVVPQLLHDDLLAPAALARVQRALFRGVPAEVAAGLPVSPLSMAERALALMLKVNPRLRPLVLGGDHSTAWPVVRALHGADPDGLGVVQVDAHTDLLEERLGIPICFATWSHHANTLLGRGGRLVQLGIRASLRPREHWEGTLGVRQFWASVCLTDPAGTVQALVQHLRAAGVRRVYFSNDIDGTDASVAEATGTPEPGGLTPDFVVEVIRALAAEFTVVAADVMEVAPPLGRTVEARDRTLALACRYLRESVTALTHAPGH